MLRDEAVRGLQHVLLGRVEQEHGVVARRGAGRQRAHRLQQHGAARAVVARACAVRTHHSVTYHIAQSRLEAR